MMPKAAVAARDAAVTVPQSRACLPT
jgi:hypothetical protein